VALFLADRCSAVIMVAVAMMVAWRRRRWNFNPLTIRPDMTVRPVTALMHVTVAAMREGCSAEIGHGGKAERQGG
jgi:hypothetical protein